MPDRAPLPREGQGKGDGDSRLCVLGRSGVGRRIGRVRVLGVGLGRWEGTVPAECMTWTLERPPLLMT